MMNTIIITGGYEYMAKFKNITIIILEHIYGFLNLWLCLSNTQIGISYNRGIAVCSHFLAEDALQKRKIKVIWEGNTNIDTTNALYLTYNKMKVTDELKKIIKKIIA